MISAVKLRDFRSYRNDSFEFESGVNIVVGPNASGKTNLLEAVLVLARGSSFRARDNDLIRFDRPWARLDGFFDSHSRGLKLDRSAEQLDKTYLIDDKPYKRLSLDKTIPVVYFEPNHLQLIIRGPDQRREYFDELLQRSRVGYGSLLRNYYRTLAQRNSLLKRGPTSGSQQLFAWNIRISELGDMIVRARNELAEQINQGLSKTYSRISGKRTSVSIEYKNSFPVKNYASRFLAKLASSESDDYAKGFTGCGPHREDFLITIKDEPASSTASRGENRSLVIALKIFELEMIEAIRNQVPIFLLDDVFSELDGGRRQALVDFLENRQTILTTTDAEAAMQYFSGNNKLIPLQAGK